MTKPTKPAAAGRSEENLTGTRSVLRYGHWALPRPGAPGPVGSVTVFARDVTERRLAEIQIRSLLDEQTRTGVELHHAHQLENVGQLALRIAHEINTPVQSLSAL